MEKYVIFDINNEKSVKTYFNNSMNLIVENKSKLFEEFRLFSEKVKADEIDSEEEVFNYLLCETSFISKLCIYDLLSRLVSLSEAGYVSDEDKKLIQELLDDEKNAGKFLQGFQILYDYTFKLPGYVFDIIESTEKEVKGIVTELVTELKLKKG